MNEQLRHLKKFRAFYTEMAKRIDDKSIETMAKTDYVVTESDNVILLNRLSILSKCNCSKQQQLQAIEAAENLFWDCFSQSKQPKNNRKAADLLSSSLCPQLVNSATYFQEKGVCMECAQQYLELYCRWWRYAFLFD